MIVVYVVVHKRNETMQRAVVASKQMLLKHASVVERIYLVRLLYPRKCFFFLAEFAQYARFKCAGLVIVRITDECALYFVECIVISQFACADTCCFEVSCICPAFVP